SFATRPWTVTRPASIQPSISRRDPSPAAARSFCRRSAVGAGGGGLLLLAGFFGTDSRFRGGDAWLKSESLSDFRQRRQLFQRAQAEVVEETAGRGVERGASRRLAVADDVDPAARLQRLDDLARNADAAHILDIAAGDRLPVGDD